MSLAFVAFLLAYTLSQFYRAFLAVIAADLARDLALGPGGLGSLSAIWFAAFALAQFPVGYALDRIGPRRTVAILMLVAVAGALWFCAAHDFASALAAMALIGVGCSPVLMGAMYYFGRVAAPDRFALLASLLLGLGSAGNLLGAAPLAFAAQAFGWRASLVAIALCTAASAALCYAFVRDPPRAPPVKGDTWASGMRAILALRPIRLMLAFVLVSYAAVAGLRSLWIAPYFGETHGFDGAARGHAALLLAAAMSLGALSYGGVAQRVGGPKSAVCLGTLAAIASLAGLAVFGADSALLSLAFYAALGFFGITYAILMAHARTFFPTHLLGRGVTTMNFLSIGGVGLLQWASGGFVHWAAAAGWAPAAIYAALHGGIAVLLLLALAPYALTPAQGNAK